MKNKKGLIWAILFWLFIFIVGSLIVSFLIYPQNFQSFKSNVKSINSPLITNGISSLLEPSFECNEELNEWIKIKKLQKPRSFNVWIVEKKTFLNKEELVDYAYNLKVKNRVDIKRNLKIEEGEINSVLIKSEGRIADLEYSNLRIFICDKGVLK